jgi:hypothetical protein
MAPTKPAIGRGEGDPVLGIDGVDRAADPDDMQEPGDLAGHPRRS